MTDNWNDDELQEALNNEVPAPGGSYWSNIDAMLQSVAAESADSHEFDIEEISESSDTDDSVIRLTDMTTSIHPTPTSRFNPLLLVAAAAIVLAGIAGVFLFQDSSSVPVDTADDQGIVEEAPEPVPAEDTPVAPDETDTEALADDAATEPIEEPAVTTGDTELRCYEVVTDFVPDLDPGQWFIQVTTTDDGQQSFESFQRVGTVPDDFPLDSFYARGSINADGIAPDVFTIALPGALALQADWTFGEGFVDDASSGQIFESSCESLGIDAEEAVSQIEAARFEVNALFDDRNVVFGEPTAPVAITGEAGTNVTISAFPGSNNGQNDVVGNFILSAQINNVPTSGRTATFEGVPFVEIALPVPNTATTRLGWVETSNTSESLTISELVDQGTGRAFGTIEEVVPRDDTGLASLVLDGVPIYLNETVIANELELQFEDLLDFQLLNPDTTIEFTIETTSEPFPTITAIEG